ncbi:MAG: Kelch repeat-containing protein, partial [Bythopirellula sp.]
YGQATIVDDVIYLAGGQSDLSLDSAMNNFWSLDLSARGNPESFRWKELEPWPGPPRTLNLTVAQHDGDHDGVYVMSGRFQDREEVKFLVDTWQFTPQTGMWRQRADMLRPAAAGVAAPWRQSHVLVLGGDDGKLFGRADELKDAHPGFEKEAFAYHTITDSWTSAGAMPQNKVTTIPVIWDDQIILACGEIRPRVRTPEVWSVKPKLRSH